MMRSDNGRDNNIHRFVYPEPWCFEQTPEDQIESHTFDLSKKGQSGDHMVVGAV